MNSTWTDAHRPTRAATAIFAVTAALLIAAQPAHAQNTRPDNTLGVESVPSLEEMLGQAGGDPNMGAGMDPNAGAQTAPMATTVAPEAQSPIGVDLMTDPLAANAPSMQQDDMDQQMEETMVQTGGTPVTGNNPLAATLARAMGERGQQPAANPLGVAAGLPVAGGGAAVAASYIPQSPEEAAAQAEMEAEEQKNRMRDEAFEQSIKTLLPLGPNEIRRTLEVFKDSRQAAETPIATPSASVKVTRISLDPAATPEIIKTAPGHVTTITLLDMSGQPWPVQDVSWAGRYELAPPEDGGHVIRVTPSSAHGIGNISIRLVDLVTPITFSLQTGLDEVYYRYDATVPGKGPLYRPPLMQVTGPTSMAGDIELVSVLDGVPPSSATALRVDGVDGRTRAWEVNGTYYLRTPLSLLSPAWNASATSADGTNVYAMNAAPVLLLSDQGRMVKAQVRTAEGITDEQ